MALPKKEKEKLKKLMIALGLFLVVVIGLIIFNVDIAYILAGITALSLYAFPYIYLGKQSSKKSNNFEKKYEGIFQKLTEEKEEIKNKLKQTKEKVRKEYIDLGIRENPDEDDDVKYYEDKLKELEKKEKTTKEKYAKDSVRIKDILKKEDEKIKEMGKTGIPSYDEQFAKTNKDNMLKIIGIVLGSLLLVVWLSVSIVVYRSYTNRLTDREIILKNSVIEVNGKKFTGEMFIKFDEKLGGLKEHRHKYPTDEDIKQFGIKLEHHKENSFFKVFNKSFEDKDMKWAVGLEEAVKIQDKYNEKYLAEINNIYAKIIELESKPNLSKKENQKLKAIQEFYAKEQATFNALNDYKMGLTLLDDKYAVLLNEYGENKGNGSFIISFIVWWFNVSIWFLLIAGYVARNFLNKKKVLTTHGSSKWAEMENLLLGKDSQKPFATDLLVPKGVVMGKYNGHTLRDNSKTHILVGAPTRTGKGVSLIIPTLIDSWNESVFVLDIKGENYQLTSGFRKERFNNKIIRLAPMSTESCKYNPMNEIDVAFEGGLKESEQIDNIATLLSQSEKPDPFWDENGSIFIQGLMTFALYKVRQEGLAMKKRIKEVEGRDLTDAETLEANRRAGFSDINDVLVNPDNDMGLKDYLSFLAGLSPNKNKNGKPLYGVPALEVTEGDDGKKNFKPATDDNFIKHFDPTDLENNAKLIGVLENSYPTNKGIIEKGIHPSIQKLFSKICTMSENMFGSVKAVGETKLKMFSTPIVRYNTSSSDFRIWDLMNYKTPVSLYLVIEPKDLVTMSPFARIVLIQIVNGLTSEMDYISGKGHKWRLLFVLDEFPALGKMEVLEKGIGYVAGYGMKLMIILQSLDQLFNIYGEKNGFMSNCAVQIFYTANENQTAKYVSETFGSETIEYENKSGMKAFSSGTKSETRQARNLLSVSEVRNLPSDKILISVSGKPPILTEKIQYFKVPEYKGRTKIPYVISEGLDKIEDNKNIENDLSYKLVNPDNDDILNRYEVFYEPKNEVYGVESTFYRYYKVCYVLGYMKQPLIFARYETISENNKTTVVAKGFVGDLLNNFDYNGKNKGIVLSRARTGLIKHQEDILSGVISKVTNTDLKTYYKESIAGEGKFADKEYKKATGKDLEHLFDLDNQSMIDDLDVLNRSITMNKGEEFSNLFLPINSTLILDLEETDKDRAEMVFYGASLYDGLLETILKVNGSTNIKDNSSKGENSLSEEIVNPNNTEELILTSYENFYNFLKEDKEKGEKSTVQTDDWEQYFSKYYGTKSPFLKVKNDNGGVNSLQIIFEERIKEIKLALENNKNLEFSLKNGKKKYSKFDLKAVTLKDEDGNNVEQIVEEFKEEFKEQKVLGNPSVDYDLVRRYWINYTSKLDDEKYVDFIHNHYEDFVTYLAKKITRETYVMILSKFEVIDPQTERVIEHKIYVPIKMKVVDLEKVKEDEKGKAKDDENKDLDKQKMANAILRNLIKYLRNNNATWNALQKDVRSSLVEWEKAKEDTQLRKEMLDNVG